MITEEQKNELSSTVQSIIKNTEYFIGRNNLTLAIQHINIILASASKGYLKKDDVKIIINFLMQQETSPSFYGSLLLESKVDEAYRLFEIAVNIASKYHFDDEKLALQGQIGSLLTEGVHASATRPEIKEKQPQYRSAFNNLHAVLRGRHEQGTSLEGLIATVYNINNLEARYYFSMLKEFIVDRLKRLFNKTDHLAEMRRLFNTIDFVGQRLIVNDLTTKAWELYAITQPFMTDEFDATYIDRFCTIGSNIKKKPELPELSSESEFTENPPTLADYLTKVPVRAEWQKYFIKLANTRNRFSGVNSDNVLEVQKDYTEDVQSLVSDMMIDAVQIVGLSPEISEGHQICFCLLALGSVANKTTNPYSDLEFAFLIQDIPDLSLSKQRDIKEYFNRLLRLFEFMVASLGEYSPPGLHFDKEGHPLSEERLYGTPKQLIAATQLPIAPTLIDPLSYSLYHTCLLYGDQQLFAEYAECRHNHLTAFAPNQNDYMHRIIAKGFIKLHIKEFDDFSLQTGVRFDIKKPIYTFLNYIILDLALYNNVASSNYDFSFGDALAKLESLCKISTNFACLCRYAMQIIQTNRIRAQITNKQQLELFYYPLLNDFLKKQKTELIQLQSDFTSTTSSHTTLLVEFMNTIKYCEELIQKGEAVPEKILATLGSACVIPDNSTEILQKAENIISAKQSHDADPKTVQRMVPQQHQENTLAECKNRFSTAWQHCVRAKELIGKAIEQAKLYHQYNIQMPDEMFVLMVDLLTLLSEPQKISEHSQRVDQLDTWIKRSTDDLKEWSRAAKLSNQQFQEIFNIYQGILVPLHWAAKYFTTNREWKTDPAMGMFTKSVEQYHDREKPISAKDLRVSIKSIIYYLALRKANSLDYYRYLSRLEESFYDYFFRIVEEAETSVNSNLSRTTAILVFLRYYPYESGRRKQVELNDTTWFETLKSLLVDGEVKNDPSVYVQCISQPGTNSPKIEGLLQDEIFKRIPPNFFIGKDETVCKILYAGRIYYLKRNVQAPAIECAANLFRTFLVGDDTVRSELMKWTLKDGNRNEAFAVTIVSGGDNELTPIQEAASGYCNLSFDHKAYSLAFLFELLITPDRRAANSYYYMQKANDFGPKTIVPVCLFNNFAFSNPGNIYTASDGSESFHLKINPLLLMQPEMFSTIHSDAREEFLRLDAGRLLCEVLLILTNQYKSYLELFGKQDGKDIRRWITVNQSDSQTYFMFPGFITHLYNTIVLIQNTLKTNPDMTHQSLLQLILPTIAYYHEIVRSMKLPDNFDDFIRLTGTNFPYDMAKVVSYSEESKKSLVKSPSQDALTLYANGASEQNFLKPREVLAELAFLQKDGRIIEEAIAKAKNGDVSEYDKLALIASRDKVLAAIDYREYTKKHYDDLLQAILKTEHREFILLNLQYLTDRDLLQILGKSAHLRILHIVGCNRLTCKSMHLIAENCKELQELDVSGIAWSEIAPLQKMENLRILRVKNCAKLKRFEIDAPNVRFFYANGCEQLEICKLGSQRLVKVTLSSCYSLSSKVLIRLIRPSNRSLSILDISECNALDHLNSRATYLQLNYAEYIPEKFANTLVDVNPKKIDLSGCELTEYHMLTLKQYLVALDTPIHELNFSDCIFTLRAEQLLPEITLAAKEVHKVILDRATFSQPIEIYVNRILEKSFIIHSLSLIGLNIDDSTIKEIAPYLKKNRFIFDLNLSNNKITDKGVIQLLRAIKNNIGVLNLANNDINFSGIELLFGYLQSPDCLIISLDLHGNPATSNDDLPIHLQQWIGVVDSNKSLTSCLLIAKNITHEEPVNSASESASVSRRFSIMPRSNKHDTRKRKTTPNLSLSRRATSHAAGSSPIDDPKDSLNEAFVAKNQELCNALTTAVHNSDIASAKKLVEQGVSFLARNIYGHTALHEAVVTNQIEILNYFLSKEININIFNIYGQSVTDLAKGQDIYDVLRQYIKSREELQKKDNTTIKRPPQFSFLMFYRATERSLEYFETRKKTVEKREEPDTNEAFFDMNDPGHVGPDPHAEYKFSLGTKRVSYYCAE